MALLILYRNSEPENQEHGRDDQQGDWPAALRSDQSPRFVNGYRDSEYGRRGDHDASRPRNPSLPGYALPTPAQVDVAGEPPHKASRIVFRPGRLQYTYILLLSALPIAFGISMIQYGFTIEEHDWANRSFFGLLMIALGAVPAAYFLGMRIEVDDDCVSKVYMFGLFRHTIQRQQLRASHHEENEATVYEFKSADGKAWGFSAIPFWVWRSADMNFLVAVASENPEVAALDTSGG